MFLTGYLIAASFTRYIGLIGYAYDGITVLLFVIIYIDSIRNVTIKMLKLFKLSSFTMIFYLLVCFTLAAINRIVFLDYPQQKIEDEKHVWFTFSTRSIMTSIITVIGFWPASNFPNYMLTLDTFPKKLYGQMICYQTFFIGTILITVVQTTVYYYYQTLLKKNIAEVQKDDKLYIIVVKEFKEFGFINPKLLKYIVEKNCENPKNDFRFDEQFKIIKRKTQDAHKEYNEMLNKRKEFYEENFGDLNNFRKKWGYRLVVFLINSFFAAN